MTKKDENIYQFKITLKKIKPTIWRRIQVPETYTFWDLHVAIQNAMGWENSHLHQFQIINPKLNKKVLIGIPLNDGWASEFTLPGWKTPISSYFSSSNKLAIYEYDFGDDWEHKIVLEKIIPSEPNAKYPCCLAGERACPPEDCGGVWGYEELLEIIKDPNDEEYQGRIEWLGREFNPEGFKLKTVKFGDPKEHLKLSSIKF